jgi:hypothetical protein
MSSDEQDNDSHLQIVDRHSVCVAFADQLMLGILGGL